ncbi:sulfite exporter TauE/SafE family protein [Pseudonocardia sp.]|uniref:sulfite exporter TauE/SafE family protein n=1 Tax=Pseudonocardia sp. TaxID=60912 RepID=UPI003D0C8EF5
MTAADVVLLVVAGFGAGLSGSMAGLASLVSYPALLAVGLPAVAANVTNTVALTANAVGAAASSRVELSGQSARLLRFAPVVLVGGATGAWLLLVTPPGAFERIVPVLIAAASLVLLLQPRLRPAAHPGTSPSRTGAVWVGICVFAVAVYGGYFGAAAGVLLLALLMVGLPVSLLQGNALKNILLGVANAVAAIAFALLGPVDWVAAAALAAGVLAGGYLGPAVARRVPTAALRIGIGLAGLALAVVLAVDTY